MTGEVNERTLVLASGNAGKAREFRAFLEATGWTLLLPGEAGIDPIEVAETGRTYLENATLKADAYARASGLPALADDSGLEVDALDGAPGVLSARFGAPEVTDDAGRCALLLERLEGVPEPRRTARFRAVLVLAVPGGLDYAREGTVEGRITREPRGANGFGYDPVFELADGRTMAELGDEKQSISHRAAAMRAMMEVLDQLVQGGDRPPLPE
jgi:XTP/dITP diphosphohydrolase